MSAHAFRITVLAVPALSAATAADAMSVDETRRR